MTEMEKLQERIIAVNESIESIKHAATVDRKMSSDKHANGHFTKALTEMTNVQTHLNSLKARLEATK